MDAGPPVPEAFRDVNLEDPCRGGGRPEIFRSVDADVGYNSEANHRFFRETL
jgi:hypothetical protein